jgi:hypothetical protein
MRYTIGAEQLQQVPCFIEKCTECFATVLGRGNG